MSVAQTETSTAPTESTHDRLIRQFQHTRQLSESFCQSLELEDYGLQAMPETSPPKWHLAHTTWFFETFILKVFQPEYRLWHPQFEYLFNSYYNGIGAQFPRPQRGLLSRPSVGEVLEYRHHVDECVVQLLRESDTQPDEIAQRVELGIHHEQQHQELFFTDIKYSFSANPLNPALTDTALDTSPTQGTPLQWFALAGGLTQVGATPGSFHFDNEAPRHTVFIEPFHLANRLITNEEFLDFIEDGGYRRPELWLADGWSAVQTQNWQAPLYWRQVDGVWYEFTLHGLQPLDWQRPVCHVSAYEADAFARWYGARLPTEFEWECATHNQAFQGQFVDSGQWHPQAAQRANDLEQLFGTLWQWTSSAYSPYPGFQSAAGAIGEYNGKFMCNQLVLRGGSCVTSRTHVRPTYRNFFYPPDRWQFTGIRLARS